jgi:hypothetical protein
MARLSPTNILNRGDRREVLFFSACGLETVLDLMLHVESTPPQHVRETDASGVAGDGVTRGRREGNRLPAELLERRALPADGGCTGGPFQGAGAATLAGSGDDRATSRGHGFRAFVPLTTKSPEEGLPESRPTFFHPRNRSTDFVPRRRGDLAKKPED